MSKLIKVSIALMILVSSIISVESIALAAKDINVAMVLWRGETQAEKGFKAKLKDSNEYNITFKVYNADQNKENLDKIIEGLDTSKYDLIYTFGTTVTKKIKAKVKDKPIVFCIVARPVKAGVIDSWESSGSNVVGASNAVPMSSAFQTLSRVLYIGRLGIVYNPKEANSKIQRDEVDKLQEKFGYELVDAPVDGPDKIPGAIEKLVENTVDAVLLPSDSMVKANANKIISPLNENKIPTIVSIPGMVKDNRAFIGLGPDYFDLGQLAADKALTILGGKKPTDIPSSTLDRLHMTVNLKTAREIGVNVPIQILRISTVVR